MTSIKELKIQNKKEKLLVKQRKLKKKYCIHAWRIDYKIELVNSTCATIVYVCENCGEIKKINID